MIPAVLNDEIDAYCLQKQEYQEIQITADEEKDVSHSIKTQVTKRNAQKIRAYVMAYLITKGYLS